MNTVNEVNESIWDQVEAAVQAKQPSATNEDAYIQHLAGLSLLEYGRQRKTASEELGGVPLGILDKLVNAARNELETGNDGAGTSILFDDVDPWPTPVNGANVLDDAYALLCRYVIADRETLRAAALWAALTWYADAATVLPLALIAHARADGYVVQPNAIYRMLKTVA